MAEIPSLAPSVSWPWHLRHLDSPERLHGGSCIYCGREVAARKDERVACLYCGMDRGMVEMIEKPLLEEPDV